MYSSAADEPSTIKNHAIRVELDLIKRTLNALAASMFHLLTAGRHLEYRASPAAVATHGHATIQTALLRILRHETGQPRHLNVDLIDDAEFRDSLVVVRDAPDVIWVLLKSEYVHLGFPLP